MAKTHSEDQSNHQCEHTKNIVIVGINQERKQAVMFNPPCKQWSCSYCGEKNAETWVYAAMRGTMILLEDDYPMQFVTLTSRAYATPNKSLYFFQQNWPKLVRRAVYHTGKDREGVWAYFMIPERTKRGILHVHMIARTRLSERWWKDNAYQCGFGYEDESEEIKTAARAAYYASKYLGKDARITEWPKGFRRVRTSRNWPKSDTGKNTRFEWSTHNDESAWFEYYLLSDYGYEIKDTRKKHTSQ